MNRFFLIALIVCELKFSLVMFGFGFAQYEIICVGKNASPQTYRGLEFGTKRASTLQI
jgi:hypothetical protein